MKFLPTTNRLPVAVGTTQYRDSVTVVDSEWWRLGHSLAGT